ncbi:endonuclease/exonuclease/phosphatase family protein [Sphingomonas sp. SUN019]|uniref:endonuclease/exonuclease/phosphatase family protein n=1 Tax=Sphingomonas sp. SUN019 TaxID=2937788 RepID=UPI002164CFE3|nr:endonuclease/exonuclease/phosphatase family protein [Sphingomonas sp. SUN019]UVO49033.1 endonuclease/exonuclease/phosphatase family protein [Sphingomonas sp. SUN019]
MRLVGSTMVTVATLAAWIALLGAWSPTLDAVASFLPLFAIILVAGLLIARRRALWTLLIAAVGIAPMAVAATREATRAIPPAPAGAHELRVLTHNVWFDNATPAATGAAIAAAGADVVLLQETTRARGSLIAATTRRFPYRTRCPEGGCGLTILSRWPIRASGYFLEDARGRKFGPPLLWADIAVPGLAPVRVATVHYPWPLPARRQAEKRAAMSAALDRVDRRALIVAGDMNLTPWSSAMRAQDEALAPLARMTRATWSWPSVLPFLPIDQLYAGPAWGLVRVDRLAATGSDHLPLLITLGQR